MSVELYFDILKFDDIRVNEFELMKDMFGEREVDDFFEKVLKGVDLDNILKVNKILDSYIIDFQNDIDYNFVDSSDRYVDDVFSGYVNSIRKLKILTLEEDKKYGKLLLDNRDVLDISMDDDNNIFKDVCDTNRRILDIEKIFVSITDEKDRDEILKLLNDYYNSEIWNENKYDKIIKYYIREYMVLSNMIGRVPDCRDLNNYFNNKNNNIISSFDINKRTNNINGLKNNLRKYLTYMYARNVMIIHNLKLVCSIAKRFRQPNTDIMDIINDGNIGLLYSVDRYDYRKGCKFSTFAYVAVKQAILRCKDNKDKMIRMPVYFNEIYRKINKYRDVYVKKNGVFPTVESIECETGIPLYLINIMLNYEEYCFSLISLNTLVGDGEELELIECLSSKLIPTDEQAMRNVVREIVLEVVNGFDDREKEVIIKRYGLDGNGVRTLEEIGMEYNLTRQRINQIENIILKKLSRKKEIVKLKGFYK